MSDNWITNDVLLILEVFIANLYCPETGERTAYEFNDELEDDGTYNAFAWRDGNFSCDCNRFDFLRPGIDNDEPCSEGKVKVESIYRKVEPQRILYAE